MFCTLKLSFNVDTLTFLATFPKIGQNFNQLSGHTGLGREQLKRNYVLQHFRLAKVYILQD
jgi:hypothetical protein